MTIIKYPLATEKSIKLIETENKLSFAVDGKATKKEIRVAIEKLLNAKVLSVNTQHAADGEKYAYIKFSTATPAIDIATKLGII